MQKCIEENVFKLANLQETVIKTIYIHLQFHDYLSTALIWMLADIFSENGKQVWSSQPHTHPEIELETKFC